MYDLNNRCFELILVKTLAILLLQPFDVYFSVASVCRRWMQTVEEHSFRRRLKKLTANGEFFLFTCIQTTTYNLFQLCATFNQSTTSLLYAAKLQIIRRKRQLYILLFRTARMFIMSVMEKKILKNTLKINNQATH